MRTLQLPLVIVISSILLREQLAGELSEMEHLAFEPGDESIIPTMCPRRRASPGGLGPAAQSHQQKKGVLYSGGNLEGDDPQLEFDPVAFDCYYYPDNFSISLVTGVPIS